MPVITHIEDLRVLAEKRVPRMFYDYADSGSWTEGTYRANEADFHKIKLRQRVAVNMENRSTATRMVGENVQYEINARSSVHHSSYIVPIPVPNDMESMSVKICTLRCLIMEGELVLFTLLHTN